MMNTSEHNGREIWDGMDRNMGYSVVRINCIEWMSDRIVTSRSR